MARHGTTLACWSPALRGDLTMKPLSPFVYHQGEWFVRPFEKRATAQLLRATLEALIRRCTPGNILLMRPLSVAERRLLEQYRADCEAELLARLLAPDEIREERDQRRRRS
jgi:hypothetical protein